MAEIRRKLVIVGDGACGKTCLLMYALATMSPQAASLPLALQMLMIRLQRLLQGHLPRGQYAALLACIPELRQPSWSASASQHPRTTHHATAHCIAHTDTPARRSTSPPFSRTMSPTSRSMVNTWSSPSGIPPARRITTVSARSHTPTRTLS
jgi:GTPase SAR1 family protein